MGIKFGIQLVSGVDPAAVWNYSALANLSSILGTIGLGCFGFHSRDVFNETGRHAPSCKILCNDQTHRMVETSKRRSDQERFAMSIIKKDWSSEAADSWTKEDLFAVILSVLSFFMVFIGTCYAFLLQSIGFIFLGIGAVLTFLTFRIINPKLNAVSADYEKKQKKYLENLEKIIKWEEIDE